MEDLLAQALREAAHPPLRHVVDGAAGARDAPGDRRDVDHVAAQRAVVALQQRDRGVRAVEEPEAVDLDHPPPLLRVGALDGAEEHHAGVVDEDVQAPEALGRALDEGAGGGLVGDVDLERLGLAALLRDPRGEVAQAIGPPRAERHRGPRPGARERRRLADPRGRPRDRHCRALELCGHGPDAIRPPTCKLPFIPRGGAGNRPKMPTPRPGHRRPERGLRPHGHPTARQLRLRRGLRPRVRRAALHVQRARLRRALRAGRAPAGLRRRPARGPRARGPRQPRRQRRDPRGRLGPGRARQRLLARARRARPTARSSTGCAGSSSARPGSTSA